MAAIESMALSPPSFEGAGGAATATSRLLEEEPGEVASAAGRTENRIGWVSTAGLADIDSESTEAIISIDESQRITAFNDAASLIFGYSARELAGAPLDMLIPERFRVSHGQQVARFSAGRLPARHMAGRSARVYGRRKNGEEFATEAAISKNDVNGSIQLTVCLRDISFRQRSEDAQRLLAEAGEILVRAGSDYQRLVTDIAGVIVRNMADWCVVDIVQGEGVRRIRVVHSDPTQASRCQEFEHQPGARGRHMSGAVPVESRRPMLVNDPTSSVLQFLAYEEGHLEMLRALNPASLILIPLVARGHSLGTLMFGSGRSARRYDARDMREAEQLASRVALALDNARLYEALERAIRARDDILGIVAHDLRSPLNAIMLRARSLKRKGAEPERRNQGAADGIQRAALNMHRLIADLLDVSRLEAGKSLSISPESVATTDLLRDAVERQRAAHPADHRDIRLEMEKAPPHVWADRSRLLQVFDNLLGNAMKFSRSQITVGAGTKGDQALFWVADDGCGISAEHLSRVFDRFWQASRTDRTSAGLGLSIAQGIMHAHGGSIWAESMVGAGTTFYFALPPRCTDSSTSDER